MTVKDSYLIYFVLYCLYDLRIGYNEVLGMKDIIAKYRGNYIAEMRKDVGHAPLMVISCGGE